MIKTIDDFNEKWSDYLNKGDYGLSIVNPLVTEYLDREFEREVKDNPTFTYSQKKLKFGKATVYAASIKTSIWENEINKILNNTEPAIDEPEN